jgi:hypothetical protein
VLDFLVPTYIYFVEFYHPLGSQAPQRAKSWKNQLVPKLKVVFAEVNTNYLVSWVDVLTVPGKGPLSCPQGLQR